MQQLNMKRVILTALPYNICFTLINMFLPPLTSRSAVDVVRGFCDSNSELCGLYQDPDIRMRPLVDAVNSHIYEGIGIGAAFGFIYGLVIIGIMVAKYACSQQQNASESVSILPTRSVNDRVLFKTPQKEILPDKTTVFGVIGSALILIGTCMATCAMIELGMRINLCSTIGTNQPCSAYFPNINYQQGALLQGLAHDVTKTVYMSGLLNSAIAALTYSAVMLILSGCIKFYQSNQTHATDRSSYEPDL